MYCSRCGVQNSDGAIYCLNCGNVLMEVVPPAIPGQPQSSVFATTPKTCGLATASMVIGILSVFCVTWPICGPLAIIFGIIALVKINGSNGQLKGKGFAVTGIVIPAIMIVLIGLLIPEICSLKGEVQTIVCYKNLETLSSAMHVYRNDYDDNYPTPEKWCDLLIEKTDVSPKSFQCPEDPEGTFSYAINKNIYGVEFRRIDAQMVVLFETHLGKNGVGGLDDVVLRHKSDDKFGCNIVFADGHVEFVPQNRIAGLRWTVEE